MLSSFFLFYVIVAGPVLRESSIVGAPDAGAHAEAAATTADAPEKKGKREGKYPLLLLPGFTGSSLESK